ncbi:S-adenosyl-L-methionine-dependent methyltransferase [Apiospora rasikravindrae]|uniref:S-adenosyl-L-methionine-dependent methyltransferase n=1 Tax=Apiospora rasikravindrae TaxID=990691 RepID=A0ABR1SYG3_9PEZI
MPPHMAGYDTDTYGRVPTPFSIYDNDPYYGSVTEPSSGRTYQNFKPGRYPLPNDDAEQDRLDFEHTLIRITLDDRLYLSPIRLDRTKHVLDVGTGTGIWANQFAEEHPQTQVLGIDLSRIQPSRLPNCTFSRVDAEEEWMYYPLKFDFVHLRGMSPCFDNPRGVLRQAFLNMNPDAWIEFQDVSWQLFSDDGTTEGTHLERNRQLLSAGAQAMGRDLHWILYAKEWLKEFDFVNIIHKQILLPLNGWPREPKWNLIGRYVQEDLCMGLDGMSRRLLIAAGLQEAQIEELMSLARNDVRNTNIHGYLPYHVVYAQKPSHQQMTRCGVAEPHHY